jgi:hypothetical protein
VTLLKIFAKIEKHTYPQLLLCEQGRAWVGYGLSGKNRMKHFM